MRQAVLGLVTFLSCAASACTTSPATSPGDDTGGGAGQASGGAGGSAGGAPKAGVSGNPGSAAGGGAGAGGAIAGAGAGAGAGGAAAGAGGSSAGQDAGLAGQPGNGGAAGGTSARDAGSAATRVTPPEFLEIKVMRDLPNFDHNGIILTFDDGPDAANNTSKVLDALKAEDVKATFCLNDHNWGALREVQFLHDVVARIAAEGHSICNHTNHHWNLTSNIPDQKDASGKVTVPAHAWTDADYDAEFMDIVTAVIEYAPLAPPITLTRAPFMARNAKASSFLQKYGVHLEVDIASGDSPGCQFTGNTACVVNGVMGPVNAGSYGIVLMHSPVPETALAVPMIIKQLKAKGKKFYTVEDVIKAKFGKSSYELYYPR